MKKHIPYLFTISAIFTLVLTIVGLGGEYPIGDDWSYNLALKHLIEHNEVKLTGWTSMPLITQLYTGKLFSFGEFSYINARISTLCLSFLNLIIIYFLSFKFTKNNKISIIASLLLLVLPEYLMLSFSFNTDVQYLFWFLLTLLTLLKYLEINKITWLISTFIFYTISILLRDLTFIIPTALITYEIINKIKFKAINIKNILISLVMIIVFIITSFLFRQFLESNHNLPILFDIQKENLFKTLSNPIFTISQITKSSFKIIIYLGIFLFTPIFLLHNKFSKLNLKKTLLSLLIAFTLTLTLILSQNEKILTYLFYDYIMEANYLINDIKFQIFAYSLITLGIFSTIYFITNKQFQFNKEKLLILFIGLLYIILFSLVLPFTRYLMLLVPLLFIVLINLKMTNIKVGITYILFLFIIISIPMVKDFNEINSNKLKVINKLTSENIKTENISAGFEFSGWYNYSDDKKIIKDYYWDRNTIYLISTQKKQEYKTIDSIKIQLYNIFKNDYYLYIQKNKRHLPLN